MVAKGGGIDFMFLGPPYPSTGSPTGFHDSFKDNDFCTAFVLRFKRFGVTHLNNISRCSAYYIQKANCTEASCLLVSGKIHQTYSFCVSRVILNKVRQILKRIAHLRSPYSRIRTFFALRHEITCILKSLFKHQRDEISGKYKFQSILNNQFIRITQKYPYLQKIIQSSL